MFLPSFMQLVVKPLPRDLHAGHKAVYVAWPHKLADENAGPAKGGIGRIIYRTLTLIKSNSDVGGGEVGCPIRTKTGVSLVVTSHPTAHPKIPVRICSL